MSKIVATALALVVTAAAGVALADISGAGATFPAPLYQKWAETYRAQTRVGLNYQAIGSGGGIKQIKAKTVDFGASDKPLKPEELKASSLVQFPTVVGGVVPVTNLPNITSDQLHLTGGVLADIYLGKIKRWNDPAIANLNKGLPLPGLPITVVHRADGSGTSFLFTTYLSMKNPQWAKQVGGSDAVEWPAGQGGKGNDGVAALVRQTPGAIGYVEFSYIQNNKMDAIDLVNRDGVLVKPEEGAFAQAAAKADWAHAPGYYILLLDQPGKGAWPITGATFILMYRQQTGPSGTEVLKFFDWAYKSGDQQAQALSYVPLPLAVKNQVRGSWKQITLNGKPVL